MPRRVRFSEEETRIAVVGDDHRLENLRVVCPNCAATLDTHCGRQNQRERDCVRCGATCRPTNSAQRHCSKGCGIRASSGHAPRPAARKVARPPYAQLQREIHALGWEGVGRRYGVSGNAVRKWVAQYEREAEGGSDAEGGDEAHGGGEAEGGDEAHGDGEADA